MGEERGNGVDGTIRLLLALSTAGGTARTSELLAATGLPRASLFRMARTLAAEGVLSLERGRLTLRPAMRAILGIHAAQVAREDEARQQRMPNLLRPPHGVGGGTIGRIALSRPHLKRANRRLHIGFANASLDNPWRVALMHAVERGASALGNRVERLDIRTANYDAVRQADDIATLAKSGIDGLLVSAIMSPDVDAAVAEVHCSGLPVVLVDRGVSPGVPHTSFVTTSDFVIGSTTALWLAETLKGEGSVLMLPGHPEVEPAQRRLAAAETMFRSFPGIRILGIRWTFWYPEVTRGIIEDALARWGNGISGVWCDSGQQGLGSLKAFVAAGKKPGEIPPHTGGDQNLAYKLAIRNRVRLAAIDYPPAMGGRAVEVLYAAMCGQWVPREVDMPSEVIITKGHTTRSVRADVFAEDHVRWDLPDDLILSTGLGPAYNPRSFRIHYPGNRYNRSAGKLVEDQTMSVVATTGVGMLARLINRLGSGEAMTAAGFAAKEGYARSTVFDVTRRMEDAGLLQRDPGGTLQPGPELVRLALASHGLAPLHGPAEALLTQLRDETHATAQLLAADGTALMTLTARRGDDEGALLEAPVGDVARLTLRLRPNTGRAEREDTQTRLTRAALSLTYYLTDGDDDG